MTPLVCSLRQHYADEVMIELCAYDGRQFRLRSTRAFAPGQPLALKVPHLSSSSIELELKSLGSVKQSDGRFEVRARPMTLSKQARDSLSAHFQLPPT